MAQWGAAEQLDSNPNIAVGYVHVYVCMYICMCVCVCVCVYGMKHSPTKLISSEGKLQTYMYVCMYI